MPATAFNIYDENAPVTRSKAASLATGSGNAPSTAASKVAGGKDGKSGVLGTRRAVLGDMTNARGGRSEGSGVAPGKKAKTSAHANDAQGPFKAGRDLVQASKKTTRESLTAQKKETSRKKEQALDAPSNMLSPSTSFQKLALDTTMSSPPAVKLFDIDTEDKDDPLMVTEYIEDIHQNYRELERIRAVPAAYMMTQLDINEKMRAILVDWLVEVHLKFKLEQQTLFLTVDLIDRYLSQFQVSRQKLQLVGVTALLVASKYEEIYPPDIRDLVYITDRAYNKYEILDMEESMLNKLKFQVTTASPLFFLNRYLKAAYTDGACADDEFMKHLSHYICERTLQEYKMVKYTPSVIAAASVFLARKILQKKQPWSPALTHHAQYPEDFLIPCVNDMKEMLNGLGSTHPNLNAVKKKYSHAKYLEIARMLT